MGCGVRISAGQKRVVDALVVVAAVLIAQFAAYGNSDVLRSLADQDVAFVVYVLVVLVFLACRFGGLLDQMADVGGEIERAARVVVAVHERYDRRTDARIQPVHHAAQFVRVGLVDKDVLVFEDSGLNGFLGVFFSIDGVYLDDAQRHAQLELVGDLLPERAVAVAPAVERCETCGLRIQSFERFVQLCEYRLVDIFLFVVGVAAGAFGQFVRCEGRRIGNRAVGVGVTGAGYTLRRCGLRLRSHAVRRRRTV